MINNEFTFINPNDAFLKCFDNDEQRKQYMYMYSEGNKHYFKHIDTRQYIKINKKIKNV